MDFIREPRGIDLGAVNRDVTSGEQRAMSDYLRTQYEKKRTMQSQPLSRTHRAKKTA